MAEKLDPNIRLIRQVAVTTVLWGATFVATRSDWLAGQATRAGRVALVAIGLAGFIPIVFVYA